MANTVTKPYKDGLFAGWLIRLTFNTMLKKRAYTNESISDLVSRSQFGKARSISTRSALNCGCANEH